MITAKKDVSRNTASSPPPSRSRRVAYLMSRFPKLTETFVLYEILAVEQAGVQVEIFPLLGADRGETAQDGASIWRKYFEVQSRPGPQTLMHAEAVPLVERAHYHPFFSLAVLQAQLHFLWRKPRAYASALWTLVRDGWGNANFVLGGLASFPKAVYFARQMQQLQIDHLHAHFANHPTTAALVIHQLTGIPFSFTAHGSDLHRDRRTLATKVDRAEFVVTISQFNRQVILDHCGAPCAAKVVVIHCGVDTKTFQPPPSQPAPSCAAAPMKILSIGTLHEVKGHTYLIEACRLLRQRGINVVCQIVGDGPDQAKLSAQIEQAELADCVQLLGKRKRDEVIRLLQEADVLAAPSVPSQTGRREGIPVVLMEAMACSVPVVASAISGIPELVQDEYSGLLVPPQDAPALAAALARLQSDSALRKSLGAAGRAKVERDFNLARNAVELARRFGHGQPGRTRESRSQDQAFAHPAHRS